MERRAPHGARGLKLICWIDVMIHPKSRPAWSAWIETSFALPQSPHPVSRPAWGAWIETSSVTVSMTLRYCRAPHGARGLKLALAAAGGTDLGRAPHGARGLKHRCADYTAGSECRAPHGARGLKPVACKLHNLTPESRPAWGAWIETRRWHISAPRCRTSHGARSSSYPLDYERICTTFIE